MKVELTEAQIRMLSAVAGFALAGEPGEPPIETEREIAVLERAQQRLVEALDGRR